MTSPRGRGRPPVATRENLQEKAVELFLAQGYGETTMEQVAESAGVGRTTLFRYFSGKPALVSGSERVFGGGLVERLLARDPAARRIDYAMPEPVFPVTQHHAWIQVTPERDGSRVTWCATYRCSDEVAEELETSLGDGVFQVGLDGLRAALAA